MFAKYLYSTRFVAIFLVHLTSFVGILSLWKVAEPLYFLSFFFAYLIGIYLDIKGIYPVRRLFLNLMGISLTLYFLSFLSLEDLLKPFSHVVLLLLSIKSLEEKKPRDLYQILLLSLFAVSISTVYNLSLSFLLVFLFHSFLGVSSLVFLNLYRKSGDIYLRLFEYKNYGLVSSTLFLLVAFFTPLFFFFLPRTQSPLFDLFSRGDGFRTGLAESVVLGKVGEIQEDNSVVFRAHGLPKDMREPYWRAVVFDTYANHTWLKVDESTIYIPKGSGDITYALVMEPSFENIVPALDYPYSILKVEGLSTRTYMTTGNVLRLGKEINRAVRVQVSSSKEMFLVENPEPYLQIPFNISPNIKKLAEELSKGAKSEEEKIERVLAHFSKGYQYSLKLEKYEGDPLDYFLFVSRKGNCEYYASATALLLRLMGIPARLVGGYKGALWNSYGGYHIVTNSMAHVWVEAYVDGKWLRIDTTPPYISPALQRISTFTLLKDYIVSFWYSNIVGYSSEKQIRLFKSMRKGIKSEMNVKNIRKHFLTLLQWLVLLLVLYLSYYLFLRLRKTPENLYLRVRDLLYREGIIKENALPEELLSACKDKKYYRLVKFIVSIYQRDRYSPYKIYTDEVREGYRALEKLRKLIRNSHRS